MKRGPKPSPRKAASKTARATKPKTPQICGVSAKAAADVPDARPGAVSSRTAPGSPYTFRLGDSFTVRVEGGVIVVEPPPASGLRELTFSAKAARTLAMKMIRAAGEAEASEPAAAPSMSLDETMAKGEFADSISMYRSDLSKLIAKGTIPPSALDGEGRSARIIVDRARRALINAGLLIEEKQKAAPKRTLPNAQAHPLRKDTAPAATDAASVLSPGQIADAAALYRRGYGHVGISRTLGIPEAAVIDALPTIRELADC